jgi:hypothetical protein
MHNRIKRLEDLVASASALIARLEQENGVLKEQVELLSAERGRAAKNSSGARELEEFKAKVRRKLARICARIEKSSELQPGLFEEESDGQ